MRPYGLNVTANEQLASCAGHKCEGGYELVLSRYILEEMVRVLPRLKRLSLTVEELRDLADDFSYKAEIVEPLRDSTPELRDPKDQLVLGTFRAAQADYLITGDKDLLALNGKWPILTPAEFWAKHGG
jgi:putative PIN family toxin of toxin-antitoxin system